VAVSHGVALDGFTHQRPLCRGIHELQGCNVPIHSPPAALRQGIAREVVDLVVDVMFVPIQSFLPSPPAALRHGIAREIDDLVVDVMFVPIQSFLSSPPAALRQGIAREVVNLEVADNFYYYHSPPAALRQGVAQAVFDLVVDIMSVPFQYFTPRGPQTGYRTEGSRPCSR
jgi:hypothetical protein